MKTLKTTEYQAWPVQGGYTDKILRIDLSDQSIGTMDLAPDFKDKYIGGRGYAIKLIWDGTTEETRYDSPENILVMASGPLGNEPRFPGSGKFIVGTISPLTETFIDSNIGGHFGPLLKTCGFDALAVTGISDTPVVVIIDADQGRIEIVEAPDFGEEINSGSLRFGEALIKKFNGGEFDERVAAVTTGVGASNARFGIVNSLFFDKKRGRIRSKQAGRGSTGTVMRFKGLMGVVVRSSQAGVQANNPVDADGVKKAGSGLKKIISQEDSSQLHLKAWGTTALIEYMNDLHLLPINNYQYGQNEKAPGMFADVFLKKYFITPRADGCFSGCNLACAKGAEDVRLSWGPLDGQEVGVDGPEYETAGAVTAMGIFDPQFIMEYNWYCDEFALDTISMGVSSAFLMECFQRGFITIEDTGFELAWGSNECASRLLLETAWGEGLGRICGQGVRRAKAWVTEKAVAHGKGTPEEIMAELNKFGMETKGLEFSMYVTKESLAQQGGYGFALKGPQHDEAWLIFIELVHKELPTFELKAEALKWFPLIRSWFNAVGLCKLPWIDVRHPAAADTENPSKNEPSLEYYVQYINATTGSKKILQDIPDDSERVHVLQKMINLRNNKGTRADDQIPLRAMAPVYINEYEARQEYYDEWLKDQLGEDAGIPETMEERQLLLIELRQKAYQKLCDTVYAAKGYTDNAIPKPETLEKFGLLDDKTQAVLDQYKAGN
ncbi:MAG: aldehyde:ferredoxin oxidoreductase [Deltaproteobacteria bacterium]|nr:aldehyde:ferredoxin oxidoreductase [Deltaproteobacteria bacterium]